MDRTNPRRPRESLHDVVDERYRLMRQIGEGGMGRVYEAEHVGIGKRVALKILHATFANTKEAVERFRSEARMTTRIANPHIVDVTDSGTTADGRFYFVMEYLDGVELDERMREGSVSLERALHITRQIAEALAAAHGQGVIHRDLKPQNIVLVDRDGDRDFVKVLDFGIALALDAEKSQRRLTQPGLAVGTPEYMAPEQALDGKADERSDVYALGTLLYEMATGRLPYKGDTNARLLLNKVQFDPPPPRELRGDLPHEVEVTIMRAMAREPEHRHQTMTSLIEDLRHCLDVIAQPARSPVAVAAPAPIGAIDATAETVAVDLPPVSVKPRRHVGTILVVLAIGAAAVAGYLLWWKPRASARRTPREGSAVASAPRKPQPEAIKPSAKPKVDATPEPAARPVAVAKPAPVAKPAAPSPPPKTAAQARTYVAKANAAATKKQWDLARDLYGRVARGKFTPALGYLGLAKVELATGDPDAALKHAKTSLRLGGGTAARRTVAAAQTAQRKLKH